jgi:chromosome segregation ATPase
MISTLEKQLQEAKESLSKHQSTNGEQMDNLQAKFTSERKESSIKIERLSQELAAKDRTLTTVENQRETLSEKLKQKEEQLATLKNDIFSEKSHLGSKLENVSADKQTALDELQKIRMEAERDKALRVQQIEF